ADHAPLAQRPVALRTPRRTGLSVTRRLRAEDALHVLPPRPLAAVELRDALVPVEVRAVHRRRRLRAVPVGGIADLVLLQRLDDVLALAGLQRARLVADDLERSADALLGEVGGDVQRGVVAGGQDVIFRVEPQQDV